MWNIRDAIVTFLYDRKSNGITTQEVRADELVADVGWQADPITDAEIRSAIEWLKGMGHVDATPTFGGTYIGPVLRPQAELLADGRESVRGNGKPSHPEGVNITISHSTFGNVAANSPHATQTATVSHQQDIAKLADAIADAAANQPATSPEAAAAAVQLAQDLREVAQQPNPEPGRVRQLLTQAGTGMAAAFGPVVGNALGNEAIGLLF